MPRAARLWVKMIDGTIDARGTSGELELYTVRGAIVVRDVSGVCSIESIDAPITLTQARGDLRLRGSRGRVEATDVQGTLSIATVSGPVVLQRISADGRVETIGGAITLTAPALDGRTLELQSHAGDITLALDPSRAPLLDLSSRAGPAIGERLTGASQFGRLSARSFKGHIAVRALR